MQATAADGRPMTAVAESFIAPNSRLTAFERLEIYNRQYWFRVLGSLAEDFPGLRAVVGGRRFEALSIAYLKEHPSRSFTLRNLGFEASRLARRASRTGRPPAPPGRRCGAHRMGFRRGLRFGGARAAHARSDRYPRWTFPAQPSAAPAVLWRSPILPTTSSSASTSGRSGRPVKPGSPRTGRRPWDRSRRGARRRRKAGQASVAASAQHLAGRASRGPFGLLSAS